jgi:hypothetical protein
MEQNEVFILVLEFSFCAMAQDHICFYHHVKGMALKLAHSLVEVPKLSTRQIQLNFDTQKATHTGTAHNLYILHRYGKLEIFGIHPK